MTCGHAALLSRTTGFAGLRETQNVGASLCPMVMIRPLLSACAQERVCTTEIREVGRVFLFAEERANIRAFFFFNQIVMSSESKLSESRLILFAKTMQIPANTTYQVFRNTTSLPNDVPYLVTAEIMVGKTGSGFDGHHYYFTKNDSNGKDDWIGIPAIFGFNSNVLDLGGSAGAPGSAWPSGSVPVNRFSAQAIVENGHIRLICMSKADNDIWYLNVIIKAERIDNSSKSDYYDQIAFYK